MASKTGLQAPVSFRFSERLSSEIRWKVMEEGTQFIICHRCTCKQTLGMHMPHTHSKVESDGGRYPVHLSATAYTCKHQIPHTQLKKILIFDLWSQSATPSILHRRMCTPTANTGFHECKQEHRKEET